MRVVGSSKGDPPKQSEAAVVAASVAFDMVGLLMHFGWFGAEARSRVGHSQAVAVEEAVHSVLQRDVGAGSKAVVVGEAQVRSESLAATGRRLPRHSRCRRTNFVRIASAALEGRPVAAGIACEGRIVGIVVADIAVVGSIVVAEMVVGVQAFGGDSSPARGKQAFHSRRTRSHRLQGLRNGSCSNSWVMQVAETETVMLMMCVLCEVNEWISEWRTAGQINQCMRLCAIVLSYCCRSVLWVLLCDCWVGRSFRIEVRRCEHPLQSAGVECGVWFVKM